MTSLEVAKETIERLAIWEMYDGFWSYTRWITYALAIPVVIAFVVGLKKRIKAYQVGRPSPGALDNKGQRFVELLKYGIAQIRIAKEAFPGLFHLLLFWGFVALFIGTSTTVLDEDLYRPITGDKFIVGKFYIVFSFLLDLAGVLAVIGITMAIVRRYLIKPDRLDNKSTDATLLVWILMVMITGFLAEGARIGVVMGHKADFGFEAYSFAGYGLGLMFGNTPVLHQLFWSIHILTSLAFLALLPHHKGLHIFSSMASIFARNLGPVAKLESIPRMMERMEEGEDVEMGYKKIGDFQWREILQADACTRCGRCQDACPAYTTGKQLSPKTFIQAIKENWEGEHKFLLQAEAAIEGDEEGGAVKTQTLWDCTNCAACVNVCPVFVDHVPPLVQMRRELAMEFDDSPQECKEFFKNMDVNANPWGINPAERAEWATEASVPNILEKPDCEYIYWLGCMGGFDPRAIEIAKATVKVLDAAKVDYAILGEMEFCCGDSLRRLGNEASFQALVMMFKQTLEECELDPTLEGKKIITTCPHCFNTLKHDYPEFGFKWEVVHHTELFKDLLEKGKLKITKQEGKAVFHDSCFLSRYNNIVEQPRQILGQAGLKVIDPHRTRKETFCCGGGGGRSWLEEEQDPEKGITRINYERTKELLNTNCQTIVSTCPFCMMMLEDASKRDEFEEKMKDKKFLDLAEVVAQGVRESTD